MFLRCDCSSFLVVGADVGPDDRLYVLERDFAFFGFRSRVRSFDLAGAVAILDELIALTPDWAEGWSQRAAVRFMQGDFEGSLADIEETLQREPRHFGSLAGMAIILMQQGRVEQAQATLRQAVGIHPFLRERGLIVEAPGEDI